MEQDAASRAEQNKPLIRRARLTDAGELACVYVRTWRESYKKLLPASVLDGLDVKRQQKAWRRDDVEAMMHTVREVNVRVAAG